MSATPERLKSYVEGHWYRSEENVRSIADAVTGEIIAEASSEGLNFGSVLDYARSRGGPALRAINQHDRARMVKALAQYLMEHKEALYELSYSTGATRKDSWIDIEGGIGAMLVMSSKARKGMPDGDIAIDGDVEILSRQGTFVGQHVYTPLQGAAIHINAFNFPVWGALEKLGPSLIAGVPAVIKPATDGSYLTHRMMQLIEQSGILPDGAVQMIAGGVGDLLDHVTCQDVISFTGSADTAQTLKQHAAVMANATRFIAEQDSLNATVLGPDATPGTEEFDLIVREIVNEVVTKAGQKCTAIRRVIVPEAVLEPLNSALATELDKVVIGNPRSKDVRMGALAGQRQVTDARARLEQLLTETSLAYGLLDGSDQLVDVDGESGAYMTPVILQCDDPQTARHVHEVEVFGPVSTLMPYTNPVDAVDLLQRGGGSLVASVFTRDADFAREMLAGTGSYHGRLLFIDRDCAKESTGHGSPLPHLVHGGPGRAGGGEEQGGVRGVFHYMQRTAVQCSPEMLTLLTQQWSPGAREIDTGVHPFRRNFNELSVGETLYTEEREITLDNIIEFAESTGDLFYAHMDEDAAAANPFFDGRVAHGYLLLSYAAGMFVEPAPGPVLANTGMKNLSFMSPVYPGEKIQVRLTVKRKTRRTAEYGEIGWDVEIFKPADDNRDKPETAARYELLTMVSYES